MVWRFVEASGTIGRDEVIDSRDIAALSRFIDVYPANAARCKEAQLWSRVAKVGEECGEVIAAMIGATNQNPRKGQTHTKADIAKELLDVAVTALAAYEHIYDNVGCVMEDLATHVDGLFARLNLRVTP